MASGKKHVPMLFPKRFATMRCAMVLLCTSVLIQSMMVTGALNVSISRIEKAFHYSSFQVAFIDTTYNVSFSIFALLFGYFVRNNKMRWVGIGTLLISFGCIIFVIPVFLNKNLREKGSEINVLCNERGKMPQAQCKHESLSFLVFLCAAYFFIGSGACTFHTIAINYINENASIEDVGMYTGTYYSFAALGPVFTFLTFSYVISFPVNLVRDPRTSIAPGSENWIGAYWIVYIVGGLLSFFISLPILLFPSKLSSQKERKDERTRLNAAMFKRIMINIFTNKAFTMVTTGMFFDGAMNNGIGVFLAKYIEEQFVVSTAKAALFSGTLIVIGASSGLFLGGLGVKYFGHNRKNLIRRIAMVSSIAVILLLYLFIRCPNSDLRGVYYKEADLVFEDSCAVGCKCDIQEYSPVCIDNKYTYYSPCVLGCSKQTGELGHLQYSDCKCYKNYTSGMTVTQGSCSSSCYSIYFFMPFGLIFLIVEFLSYTPQIAFTLRVLDDECRQFGLSCQQIIIRLSYILGPLLLGPLLDYSCKIANSMSGCNKTSNCINYDHKKLSYTVAIFSIVCKFISTVFLFIAARFTEDEPPHSEIIEPEFT